MACPLGHFRASIAYQMQCVCSKKSEVQVLPADARGLTQETEFRTDLGSEALELRQQFHSTRMLVIYTYNDKENRFFRPSKTNISISGKARGLIFAHLPHNFERRIWENCFQRGLCTVEKSFRRPQLKIFENFQGDLRQLCEITGESLRKVKRGMNQYVGYLLGKKNF